MQRNKKHDSGSESFELVETMVYKHGVRFLGAHLERMRASAVFFGMRYDAEEIHRKLEILLQDGDESVTYKIRMTLRSTGEVSGTKTQIYREESGLQKICLSPVRVDANNIFYAHKTTRRSLYEAEYRRVVAAGFDEVLFLNEDGLLTEASRHNVFLRLGRHVYTPPLHCGLLGGIYRKKLMDRCDKITEKELDMNDLREASAIYLSNSVRGLRKVRGDVSLL